MSSSRQSIRAVPQKGRGELVEAALRKAIVLGTLEPVHHFLQRQKQHPMTRFGSLHAKRDGQVGLAHARWP